MSKMSQPNRLRGVVVGGIALAGVLAGAAPVWSQTPRRAVFVVNNVSDEITAFTVNSDGTLNFVGTYATDRAPTPIAVAPGGAHLATANATDYDIELVTIFAVNPDASLSEVASTTFPNSPLSLVWINDLTVAVGESTIGSSKIHVYAFDPDLGTLTEIDQEPSGSFNTSLALSRDGRYLYAQDSSGYLIRWFAVQANGTLSFAGSVSTSGIYPLDLVITHDGTKLYAGGGISQGGHMVLGFAIDQETGQLTPLPGSPYYSPGASPAYTAVSTDDRYLFVGHGTDATVRTFAINADGSLTATGFFFDVGLQGTCGDLQTLGRLLFVTDESTAGDGITCLLYTSPSPRDS